MAMSRARSIACCCVSWMQVRRSLPSPRTPHRGVRRRDGADALRTDFHDAQALRTAGELPDQLSPPAVPRRLQGQRGRLQDGWQRRERDGTGSDCLRFPAKSPPSPTFAPQASGRLATVICAIRSIRRSRKKKPRSIWRATYRRRSLPRCAAAQSCQPSPGATRSHRGFHVQPWRRAAADINSTAESQPARLACCGPRTAAVGVWRREGATGTGGPPRSRSPSAGVRLTSDRRRLVGHARRQQASDFLK